MRFGLLIGVLSSLIVFTIVLSNVENIPFLEVAQATGSIAIGISAVVGLHLYIATVKRHKSEDERKASQEYLKESINILERAFDIFTDNGKNISPPRSDRLLWLTTARMFLRYYRIRDKINQSDHQAIIKEHEEYLRVQFYNILSQNKSKFNLAYFQPSGDKYGPNTIHRDSVGVVFDFARWYDDTEDPLIDTDVITMFAKGAVPIDQFGVYEFIEQYNEYFAKIQEKKQELNNDS